MLNLFTFRGVVGRLPYAALTFLFFGVTVAVAIAHGDGGATELMKSPWLALAQRMDEVVRMKPWAVDLIVSLALAIPLSWIVLAMTARRLRDLGQSPWWSLLVLTGAVSAPVMLVLSLVPARIPDEVAT